MLRLLHLQYRAKDRFLMPTVLPLALILLTVSEASGQTKSDADAEVGKSHSAASFEVATIKPFSPGGKGVLGFYSYPGGRVFIGAATVKMLISYAFELQEFQIDGGPDWLGKSRFDITAIPPDSSSSRTANQPPMQASPNAEQREMLRSLLADRFGLKAHFNQRDAAVYLLLRSGKKLSLDKAKDEKQDPRGGVFVKPGGIADGEAAGVNISMTFLAHQLSQDLERPVVDRTGLQGSYDFHVGPSDPNNHDVVAAVMDAMDRLGLQLKAGRAPVKTLVIEQVSLSTGN